MTKLFVLTGPTASGKSSLAVELAKEINGEIISADSMQVFKEMNIGTAKITENEKNGIVHHLINVASPQSQFSVSDFVSLAKKAIAEIEDKGKIPILTGGTGLYINALIYGFDFAKTQKNEALRNDLLKICDEKGEQFLHNMLRELSPERAIEIHPNNVKRVIRAIEVLSDKSQQGNFKEKKQYQYDVKIAVLNCERKKLYERINDRVDKMLENGLISEIQTLLDDGVNFNMQSMQGIGYKEFKEYFDGNCQDSENLKIAVNLVKLNSRHYAKRQLTWFKQYDDAVWFDCDNQRSECIKYFLE